jgi:hypothetical protein
MNTWRPGAKLPITEVMVRVVDPAAPVAAARTVLMVWVPVIVGEPSVPLLNWQRPPVQGTPLGQAVPQAPQWVGVFDRLVSQPLAGLPSQLPKPVVQVKPHRPLLHVGVVLGGVGQALLQRPQCERLEARGVSHPSLAMPLQSPKPLVHAATPQVLARQNAVALGSEHARPHIPQLAGSIAVLVQAPEQLVRPAPQDAAQLPPAQICPEGQLRPHIPQ